jgi:hypothetical protein
VQGFSAVTGLQVGRHDAAVGLKLRVFEKLLRLRGINKRFRGFD